MAVGNTGNMDMAYAGNTALAAVCAGAGGEQTDPSAVTAADVLKCRFKPDDKVCFRVFDDRKSGTFPGQKLSCRCAEYDSLEPELKRHNGLNRGVFFVVNYGGQSDKEITRINAQFVEMDEGTFDEQWKKVNNFPLPPSVVIQTRKSLHVYWFMDKSAKAERFREIQKRLVKHFDGDPACVNESRVMRLPGFYHCKTDTPVMVRCVCFHPERVYTQEQLAEVLPELEENAAAQVVRKDGSAKGLDIVLRSCLFMQYCKDNAELLPEPQWYACISNLWRFVGGIAAIHELSKPYPRYSERETQAKIDHILNSGMGPITCETIYRYGFKCPKFEQGGCGVKSPAALCYKPSDAGVLMEILKELPVTGDLLKDIQTAKQYVSDYLYNQDGSIASVIIGDALRRHFRFTRNTVRSLSAEYKAANKAYKAKAHSEQPDAGSQLPAWYEQLNGGIRFLPGVLAQHMAETEHIFYAARQYYRYVDGVYTPMEDSEAQKMVQSKMLAREAKMQQITDAEMQWRLQIRRDIKELNPDPYIINLRNGLYNLCEDRLQNHTPEYISTVRLPVNYNPQAECPKFRLFLVDAMCGDNEQVQLIQEMLGYCLIPVTSAQKCFLLVGAAGAGKSVLLRVLNEVLLGRENVSNVSWQALNERFKSAELFGKLANIFADLPTKNIDDNGTFKALVGEDCITVEKKHKDPFSFKSTARLLFSCNSIPKNYGDRSEGFYRRLIIITFNRSVPEQDRNPELLEEFRAEADGIFMFALQGLKRLMANNYKFSETKTNIDALQRYREESDSVLSFVKDSCELNPDASIGSTDLYHLYTAYCAENHLKAYSQKKFVQQLTVAFPGVEKAKDSTGHRRVLNGIDRAAE